MSEELKIKMYSTTIDCNDPQQLAKFYSTLLNWNIVFATEEWACVAPPGTKQGSYPCILFQHNPEYEPPVWPEKPGVQQQMAHLDFAVNDLKKAVEYAVQCGARVSEEQFAEEWKVLFDPAGHPFCLCEMKSIMESEHFGLL